MCAFATCILLTWTVACEVGAAGAATASELVGEVPESSPDATQLLYGDAMRRAPQYNLPVPGATAAADPAALDANTGTLVLRQVSKNDGAWLWGQ